MKRIEFLAWWAVGIVGLAGSVTAADAGALRLVAGDYPRAFYFRQSERAYAAPSFEQWSGDFGGLMGIMGKALDEEVPGRGANGEFFTRFKAARPEQAVLLHVNGNSRDPRFEGQRFFAGH